MEMTDFGSMNAVHIVSEAQAGSSRASELFSSARAANPWRRLWAAITRRPNALRTLAQDHPNGRNGHYAGRRSVRLNDIRGSEGRAKDFDDQFYPLSDRTRQRWQSVASALDEGVALPPVQLIQVGEAYYVRDGHHRVSVNRVLGQEEIEAEVTVWEP